ncbi:MAG: ABC transporter permease subunit [Alphaproteobacteria bacterium]|nr:ABC transporter permease subunit [Alphaproteobacteria bacterium]
MSTETESVEVEFVPERGFNPIHFVVHILIFAVLIGVWETANRLSWVDPLLFPRPSGIVEGMYSIFIGKGGIWPHLGNTFGKAMGGFAIGTLIGMALATGAAVSAGFRDYLKPYIIIIEAMPRIAVGPIFIAALGFGWSSAVALAALVCFFAPFVNTMTGLLQVDEETEELFRSLGASKREIFFKLRVPNAMPLIAAGVKLAVAGAFAGALVAEFISATTGLGVLMRRYVMTLNMEFSFATLLSITFFGFLLFRTMEAINYRVIYWHAEPLMQKRSRRLASRWESTMDAVAVNQSAAVAPGAVK